MDIETKYKLIASGFGFTIATISTFIKAMSIIKKERDLNVSVFLDKFGILLVFHFTITLLLMTGVGYVINPIEIGKHIGEHTTSDDVGLKILFGYNTESILYQALTTVRDITITISVALLSYFIYQAGTVGNYIKSNGEHVNYHKLAAINFGILILLLFIFFSGAPDKLLRDASTISTNEDKTEQTLDF